MNINSSQTLPTRDMSSVKNSANISLKKQIGLNADLLGAPIVSETDRNFMTIDHSQINVKVLHMKR